MVHLNGTAIAILDKCKIDKLKLLIHVRKFSSIKLPRDLQFKFSNKGTVAAATEGLNSLLMVFEYRAL